MTFSQSVSYCFQNYANFQGRARRSELWWFYLFALIVSLVIQAPIAAIFGQNTLYWIVSLILPIVLITPQLAVGARRLHDKGRSGWLQLLYFVPCVGVILLIVFFAQPGNAGDNQYGPAPS